MAATHGYATVFLVSSLIFATGGVLAAAFFPSKARLSAMRESVPVASTARASEDDAATEASFADV